MSPYERRTDGLKIRIQKQEEAEPEVIIRCRQIDENILRLKEHIGVFDRKLRVKKEEEYCFVDCLEVLYFEAVSNRTFLYTTQEIYEIQYRLYELETILPERDFMRISKSLIVNMNKIRSLKPELNRTILATMENEEQIYVSRKYVPDLKKRLGV